MNLTQYILVWKKETINITLAGFSIVIYLEVVTISFLYSVIFTVALMGGPMSTHWFSFVHSLGCMLCHIKTSFHGYKNSYEFNPRKPSKNIKSLIRIHNSGQMWLWQYQPTQVTEKICSFFWIHFSWMPNIIWTLKYLGFSIINAKSKLYSCQGKEALEYLSTHPRNIVGSRGYFQRHGDIRKKIPYLTFYRILQKQNNQMKKACNNNGVQKWVSSLWSEWWN